VKREVILAIIIGFGLGLVITLGIWVANRSLKNLPSATPEPTSSPAVNTQPATVSSGPLALAITAPIDEALVATNKVTLTGKTAPGAVATIVYEDNQTIVTADAKGDFTLDVPLVAGYNVITVTAFNAAGQSATQSLTITYSTAKI